VNNKFCTSLKINLKALNLLNLRVQKRQVKKLDIGLGLTQS